MIAIIKTTYRLVRLTTATLLLLGTLSWVYPQWPSAVGGVASTAAHGVGTAITDGQNWANGLFGRGPHASVQHTPAPNPSASEPAAGAMPFQMTVGDSPAPSPSDTPAPRPVPPPVTLVTPSPAVASAWTQANCVSMENAMAWDRDLDAKTAQSDPSGYYAMWSLRWDTVLKDMQNGPCAYPVKPLGGTAGTQCTDPEGWFATAIKIHGEDEQAHSENAAWDNQWISIYTELANLWPTSEGCS